MDASTPLQIYPGQLLKYVRMEFVNSFDLETIPESRTRIRAVQVNGWVLFKYIAPEPRSSATHSPYTVMPRFRVVRTIACLQAGITMRL